MLDFDIEPNRTHPRWEQIRQHIGREMLHSRFGDRIQVGESNVKLTRIKVFSVQKPFCRRCRSGDVPSMFFEQRGLVWPYP